MKRTLLVLVGAVLLGGLSGCASSRATQDQSLPAGCCHGPNGPTTCPPGPVARGPGQGGVQGLNDGPPAGQVTYPYYTTRGPRDFLDGNPPSIGP
jgi:hypothetical protein